MSPDDGGMTSTDPGHDKVTCVGCYRTWHMLALAHPFPLCDDPTNPALSCRGNDMG